MAGSLRWTLLRAAAQGAASESQPAVAPVPVPGVKKFGIQVVMPEGADLQPVYGAFLIDSFSFMVDQSNGWREDHYVARMLSYIWDVTGKVFMAVCKGGAAFTPDRCCVTYAQLLVRACGEESSVHYGSIRIYRKTIGIHQKSHWETKE